MIKNPWQVDSIEAFSCFKCPQCTFYCREEIYFQNHAMADHPLSSVLFGKFEENNFQSEEESNVNEALLLEDFERKDLNDTDIRTSTKIPKNEHSEQALNYDVEHEEGKISANEENYLNDIEGSKSLDNDNEKQIKEIKEELLELIDNVEHEKM